MKRIKVNNLPDFEQIHESSVQLDWYKYDEIKGIDFLKERAQKVMEDLNNVYDLDRDDENADETITEYINEYLVIQKDEPKRVNQLIDHKIFFDYLSFLIIQLYSSYAVTNLAHWINHFIKGNEKEVVHHMRKEMYNTDDEFAKRIFRYFFREYFIRVDDFVISIEKFRTKYKDILSQKDMLFLEEITVIDE